MSLSFRKHLATGWPRQEQKSHLGQLEPLFCELEEEGVEDEADWTVGTNWEHLDEDEDSANSEVGRRDAAACLVYVSEKLDHSVIT
jgi:hypothetical protein